jgi:hypothetical protein
MRLITFMFIMTATLTGAMAGESVPMSGATGRLHLTFTETSPFTALDRLLPRIQIPDARPSAGLDPDKSKSVYELSKESFEAFVPPAYDPGTPFGLFVWVGVVDMPAEWQRVFVRNKLICIAPNNLRARKDFGWHSLPLDAVHNMKKLYNIDEKRIYISGFSAGGSFACALLRCFPDVFSGGLFLMGGAFHQNYNHGKTNAGPWEATVVPSWPSWKGEYEQIKKDVKLVIMKGGADREWVAQEGRVDSEALVLDGFQRVSYLEVPAWAHAPPNAQWFEKGIIALEARPKAPPTTAPTTDSHPMPSQNAQANRLLASAKSSLEEHSRYTPEVQKRLTPGWHKKNQDETRKYFQQLLADYPTTPAARIARDLLSTLDQAAAPLSPN